MVAAVYVGEAHAMQRRQRQMGALTSFALYICMMRDSSMVSASLWIARHDTMASHNAVKADAAPCRASALAEQTLQIADTRQQ